MERTHSRRGENIRRLQIIRGAFVVNCRGKRRLGIGIGGCQSLHSTFHHAISHQQARTGEESNVACTAAVHKSCAGIDNSRYLFQGNLGCLEGHPQPSARARARAPTPPTHTHTLSFTHKYVPPAVLSHAGLP